MAAWTWSWARNTPARPRRRAAQYAADRPRREAETLHDVGIWAHFVGDGSQPLHVTIHFNGWGNGPNPLGFTLDHIHSPFETDYVHANVTDAMVKAAMAAPRDCGCAVTERNGRPISSTPLAAVAPLYTTAEGGRLHRRKRRPPRTCAVATHAARGAAELRDLIAMAWKDSDNATSGLSAHQGFRQSRSGQGRGPGQALKE